MGKYNKKYRILPKNKCINKLRSINLSIFLIILIVTMITIGYSTFYTGLEVDNVVTYLRVQEDIRLTGFNVVSSTSEVTSNYNEYSAYNVTSSINLPYSDSTITYNVEVLNIGNAEMGITAISGLPSNLTYEFDNYTLGRMLCDDNDATQCTLGSRTTIPITIKYVNGMYNDSNTSFNINLEFTFSSIQYVARIDDRYFTSLQAAVNAVPKNDTLTNIVLLKSTSERIVVSTHQNIWLDFAGLTISNSGNAPVFESSGNVTITNGLIYSTASQGAVNVGASGNFTISGGSIVAAGLRQGIYNNGGVVTISGSAYIYNAMNQRAAVQNHGVGGTIIITGGTIISALHSAVFNEVGNLIIGTKDGNISRNSPVIRGYLYGVNNSTSTNPPSPTDFSYYDGVISGGTAAIYDEAHVVDSESDYDIAHSYGYINGLLCDTVVLAHTASVVFNPGEGSVDLTTVKVEVGQPIGVLPVPTLANHVFDGWYTAASGGTKVETSTIIEEDVEFFAHWTNVNDIYIAQIGDTRYRTLASAVLAVKANTATSIILIRDTAENITIPNNKNITFDFQSYTLSSPNDNAVIVNNGRCQIIGGAITTNSKTTAAINNNASGVFTMSGGSIVAKGLRQAIYNDGGKVTISGGYLEANTSIRATIQNNASGGSIVITGGTIYSASFSAVSNGAGNLFVGVKDGNININSPLIIGQEYGIQIAPNTSFKFYDGIVGGVNGAISGNIAEIEDNSSITYMLQSIDGVSYNTAFLE